MPLRILFTALSLLTFGAGIGQAEITQANANRSFEPHPRLVDLADGEALDLGPYRCESRVPKLRCASIFDYSRINYDPFNHRFIVFGGGHAATGRTDVDAFDMRTLTWESLYPSMSCDEIAKGNTDPRGFHRETGHPVARHTYDQNVIAEFSNHGWLLMFSNEGFRGTCHPYKQPIRAPAAYPLTKTNPAWSIAPRMKMPWGYAGSAEFDPLSGLVVLLGGQWHGMWVYDPVKQETVAYKYVKRAGNSSNLIYNPRDRNMYLIDTKKLQVRQFRLNRGDWLQTTYQTIETAGVQPKRMRNFAYDSRNHVIGGIQDGVFHTLHLDSFTWQSYPITERSPDGSRIGTVRHHAIDYDPVNNVFVLVTGKPGALRTWAYRFRN